MKSTGQLGELMAVNYLRTQDFLILQQNFRTPFGELDIIAKKMLYSLSGSKISNIADH